MRRLGARCDSSNVTGIVDRLEERGLGERGQIRIALRDIPPRALAGPRQGSPTSRAGAATDSPVRSLPGCPEAIRLRAVRAGAYV